MTPSSLDEQLTKYLTDVHSIEQQALAQMKTAPKIAGDETIAKVFAEHLTETEGHERRVDERLEARGASPSKLKDIAGVAIGKGFGVFAALQPDTPGKLVAHAYAYEHMETAAYDLLEKVAERAGDSETAAVASSIRAEEEAMARRLEGCFDPAVQAALQKLHPEDIDGQLNTYLADAHAIEAQALELLDKGAELAGESELASAYRDHRAETEEHQRLIEERLEQRGSSPSTLKDAALRLGALNWGAFFAAQPDTPAKLAGFAYAFENLEIASYELLERVARRAGDTATIAVAARILGEEREAAHRIRSLFDEAVDASLAEQGLATR
jgi:ferritin-like metal-binding protein YciE